MARKNGAMASKVFLLKEMVVRDVRARYAGSGLGLLWAFAHPVLWMLLYTAVFSLVLRVPVEPGYASFPGVPHGGPAAVDGDLGGHRALGLLPASTTPRWSRRRSSRSRRSCSRSSSPPSSTRSSRSPSTRVYVALLGHLRWPWILLVVPALFFQVLLTFGARLHRRDADGVSARHRARGRHRADGRASTRRRSSIPPRSCRRG